MASIRELRGRIKSVGNIKQITRAMEMVATTKLRRFQDRAMGSRPYTEEITGLMGRLAAVLGEEEVERRPLFRAGEGEGVLVLLVTSDRGLCGAYNTNVFRALETWRAGAPGPARYAVYGKKGFQYLTRSGLEIEHFFTEPPLEQLDFRAAARVARYLVEAFLEGRCSEVKVLYTAFQSMVRYVPTWIDLLPLRATPHSDAEAETAGDVILEPDARTIFEQLVPRYLETRVYNALVEALTSEYASRRVSMKNATDAAGDMQKALKGQYNRRRQEGITKDLLDIVGGAEALR